MTNRNYFLDLISGHSTDADKTAVRLFDGQSLTYGELVSCATSTCTSISRFKIKPHERIALITRDDLTILPLTIGLMERVTCVPLDPESTPEQYREYYRLLSTDYLLTELTDGPAVEAAVAAGMGYIRFRPGAGSGSGAPEFELLGRPQFPASQPYKNDHTAFVFTTSGTTSQPKVVPVLYRNLSEVIQREAMNYDYDASSVQILIVKLFLAIAIRVALRVLVSNGQIIYTAGVHPKRIADILMNDPVTHLSLQPAGMLALSDYFRQHSIDFTPRRPLIINLGGAPLPPRLKRDVEERFHGQLVFGYGMTEAGRITSTAHNPEGYKDGSVGHPVTGEIKILDNEILVKGPGVFPGYENNPAANQTSFADGWFRTGDCGYLDTDGYLFITGRVKEMINRGGEKVSPYEIEKAILSLGNIEDVCVFPYPSHKGYENVGAAIVTGEGPPHSLRGIRAALKDAVKPYKLPTLLYNVDRLPTSAANKVQRHILHQQLQALGYAAERLAGTSFDENIELTTTQYMVMDIWKAVLELEIIALDDNFFDIGGDSLSAAEVLSAIETSLGRVLPVNEFFQKSTIRELASLIDASPSVHPYKHLVPIKPGGSKTPVFFVHERSGDVVSYHHIAACLDRERPVFGLNLNLPKEDWGPATNMRQVALAYAAEIRSVSGTGPYYLAGLSIGGQIAFEVGAVLARQGSEVMVFMIDSYSQRHIRNMALHHSVQATLAGLKNTGLAQWPQLIRKKAGTMRKQFILPKSPAAGKYHGQDRGEDEWEAMPPGKEGQAVFLKSVLQNHQPAPFPGKVVYFRALEQRLKKNDSHVSWMSLGNESVLFEVGCRHDDFVKPHLAPYTAAKIEAEISRMESAHVHQKLQGCLNESASE